MSLIQRVLHMREKLGITPAADATDKAPTLYDRLGGEPAMDKGVDIFYRAVLRDPTINYFFEDTDMDRQRLKQKAFVAMACGGPVHYTGMDMRKGHAHLLQYGLNDSHFDAVVNHLAAALKQIGASDEDIGQVAALVEPLRDDILGR